MMDTFIKTFVLSASNYFGPEILSLIIFFVACIFILILFRYYGAYGLFAFLAIACVGSNIQVLQVARFSLLSEPLALGTMLFASTYLLGDILTEYYGYQIARKAVGIAILAQVAFTVLMTLTLGFVPLNDTHSQQIYQSFELLFLPSTRLVFSSLIAYALSLLLDIWLFQKIYTCTKGRYLWLRSFLSTSISAFVDNLVFSYLAWVLLSPDPVTFKTLVFTYILGSYLARLIASALGVPIMYLSYYLKPQSLSIDNKTKSNGQIASTR